jgi:hypothetical protein
LSWPSRTGLKNEREIKKMKKAQWVDVRKGKAKKDEGWIAEN